MNSRSKVFTSAPRDSPLLLKCKPFQVGTSGSATMSDADVQNASLHLGVLGEEIEIIKGKATKKEDCFAACH